MKEVIRWVGGGTLGAVAAFMLLQPKQAPPDADPMAEAYRNWVTAMVEARRVRTIAAAATSQEVAQSLRIDSARAPLARIDPRFTSRTSEELRRAFAAGLRRAGQDPPKYPIALIATVDPNSDVTRFRHVVVLPTSTGQPCTVQLVLPSRHSTALSPQRLENLLGTCHFYAAYGKPGAEVHAWLLATRARAAAYGTIPSILALDTTPVDLSRSRWDGWLGLSACRSGRPDACRTLFSPDLRQQDPWGDPPTPSKTLADTALPAVILGQRGFFEGAGAIQPGMLAALATELGPLRFGELWRNDRPLAESFAEQQGRSLSSWVAAYVASRTLPYSRGPGVPFVSAVLATALVLAGLMVGCLRTPRRLT